MTASAVVNKANVEFVGKWAFEVRRRYQATYSFEAQRQVSSSAAIRMTPSDSATYVNGASVSAQQPRKRPTQTQ